MNTDFPSCISLDKATVIIPCYNVEAYIHECLDSVALQGDIVHHIYVVDNNSTDETVDTVRRWQNENPTSPLTLLSQTKPGAPAARNLPLSRIETKWIQFLDADDLLMADKIVHQTTSFPEADVICAASEYLAIDGSKHEKFPEAKIPLALMKGLAGNTCANLFRTSAIKLVDGWDESLKSSQEYDLMFRVWQTGAKFEVDLTPRAIIRARDNGQISQSNPQKRWQTYLDTRVQMLLSVDLSSLSSDDKYEMLNGLFFGLRMLYPFDAVTALKYHRQILVKNRFRPRPSEHTSGVYCALYRIIGFVRVEALKRIWSSINTIRQ